MHFGWKKNVGSELVSTGVRSQTKFICTARCHRFLTPAVLYYISDRETSGYAIFPNFNESHKRNKMVIPGLYSGEKLLKMSLTIDIFDIFIEFYRQNMIVQSLAT